MAIISTTDIGQQLKIRNLRGSLLRKLRETRPSLSWDTLNRAFSTDKESDVLDWIRNEAEALLKESANLADGQGLRAA